VVRWIFRLLAAWIAVALVAGMGGTLVVAARPGTPPATEVAGAAGADGTDFGPTADRSEPRPLPGSVVTPTTAVQVAAPVAVTAAAVDIHAPLVAVGKEPDGAMSVPDFGTAGWYDGSVRPGAPGSAVLAGHVDSYTGPDVFFGLERLRPGDEILVHHADGATSAFVVRSLETTPKDELPVERIFDSPDRPELRLITCGGSFDRAARSYELNVTAYADFAGWR
jgi:hypothetical protein